MTGIMLRVGLLVLAQTLSLSVLYAQEEDDETSSSRTDRPTRAINANQAPDAMGMTDIVTGEPMRWGEPYSPRKAAFVGAAFPGLGQIYNQKYWKVGLVYGAMGTVGYFAWFYHSRYVTFRGHLFDDIDGDPETINTSGRPQASLRSIVDQAQRNRDFLYIGMGLVYLLAIAEAHIDAHLSDFDMSDDLSMTKPSLQVRPLVVAEPNYSGVGIRIVLP